MPGAPLIYATLGTHVNVQTEILEALVEALRAEHVNRIGPRGSPGRAWNPRYHQNAEHVRDEMAALGGPDTTVALLERLARDQSPIIAAR